MRWKVLICLKEIKPSDKLTYGFKSPMTPSMPTDPEAKYLYAFEKDLFELPSIIKWRRFDNDLQTRMRKDIKEIKATKEVIVPADKT